MHDLGDVLLRDVHSELWPLEGLELLVNTRDAGDLALARARVDTLAVVRLAHRMAEMDVRRIVSVGSARTRAA